MIRTCLISVCIICLVAFFAASFVASVGSALVSDSSKDLFCSAPEYRQFDFWLGDWDAIEVGSTIPEARVKVTSVLEGCAVREEYDAADGHEGESLSIYDRSRKVWHQSWFTNRGQFLAIEGSFKDGEMVLAGTERTMDGKEKLVRGSWKPEGQNVRETAVTSIDGGRTWKPWFDLEFRRHR